MQMLLATRFTRQQTTAIETAILFVEGNFRNKITADDLSQQFLIPPKILQAGFHRRTGNAVHSHIIALRIQHAKLLLAGDEPLKNIPKQIGYKYSSQFGQFFKKYTGLSPAAYRNQLQFD